MSQKSPQVGTFRGVRFLRLALSRANGAKIGAEPAPVLCRWFWRSGLGVMILLYGVPQGSQTELW